MNERKKEYLKPMLQLSSTLATNKEFIRII